MDDTKSTASARLADFESRARYSPDQVLRHCGQKWRYIAVHPFADDHELLRQLEWPADRCRRVDAYWECQGDIYFLQVDAYGEVLRAPGKYYRWDGGTAYAANLLVVLSPGIIVRTAFEAIMSDLASDLAHLGRSATLSPLNDGR
jgi:hypothetical protein